MRSRSLQASKSPVEEHLERTVSEIFTELKNRKNEAAKRASIKRLETRVKVLIRAMLRLRFRVRVGIMMRVRIYGYGQR